MKAKTGWIVFLFKNAVTILSQLGFVAILFAHFAPAGAEKAAFLFSVAVASGLLGICAGLVKIYAQNFRQGNRPWDLTTNWLFLMSFAILGNAVMSIDVTVFKDLVVESVALGVCNVALGVGREYIPEIADEEA